MIFLIKYLKSFYFRWVSGKQQVTVTILHFDFPKFANYLSGLITALSQGLLQAKPFRQIAFVTFLKYIYIRL